MLRLSLVLRRKLLSLSLVSVSRLTGIKAGGTIGKTTSSTSLLGLLSQDI